MLRLRRMSAMLFAAAIIPLGLAAQSGTVTGTVTEAGSGRPLASANVSVSGTSLRTITNQQGVYRLTSVPAGSRTVSATQLGYGTSTRTVDVSAGGTATANFTLNTSALALGGITVNAVTGQAERRVESGTNTGAINVAETNKGPITQLSDVLQGRVTGVTLQNAGGGQGSGVRIRIRGANSLSLSNDPLIYIDGVQASQNRGGFTLGGGDYSRLNDINPEEIENIEVLKGPAASALYGTAAANGVVLITTKRGKAGNAVWRGYAEGGRFRDVNNYPLNYAALQTVDASKPVYEPEGGYLNIIQSTGDPASPYIYCPNYRAAIPTGQTIGGLTTCTQDVALSFDQFRDPRTTIFTDGSTTKFGANVSGGSENLTYFISGDKQDELGVLRPNSLGRLSLRTNLTAKVGSRANVGVNAAYIRSHTNRLSESNSVFSPLINTALGPAQYIPGMESDTVGAPAGRYGSYFGYNYADQRRITADQDVDRFIVGANTNYHPMSWLSINGNLGLDFFDRTDQQTVNPNYFPLAQSYILGFRDRQATNNYLWTGSGSAVATFDLSSNLVSTTTVGGSYQRSLLEQIECYGVGIPAGTTSCNATTSQFAVSEGHTDAITVGGFVRQELAIADRLFLAGSVRADNNSGLVSGLIYYPAASASWVLSSEPFFPKTDLISQLRLRVAAGESGLRPGFGQAETFFGSRGVQVSSSEVAALILTSTGNPNLKPERTREYEGGFDLGLFHDRLSADFTHYNRRSTDALISRNLAPSTGFSGSVFQNLGAVRNWGNEIGLNAKIVEGTRFSFNARLSATTLGNRIEELGKGIAPITTNRGAQAHRQGFPVGAFFALPIKYNDADNNGLLSRAEVSVDSSRFLIVPSTTVGKQLDTLALAYMGPSLPTATQSLSGEVTLFKNITVSTLFERRTGSKQLNETEYFRCRTQNANPYYSGCSALANPNASLASQAAFIAGQYIGSSRAGYIEDADFIKWRELSVRLGIPESLVNRFPNLKGAALSLSGRNLKTWTDYTGLDPEINEGGGGSNFNQGEFNTQPPVRVVTVRFDFNF
jgi:TonB-linked SusC/RagA family outer membrane protein